MSVDQTPTIFNEADLTWTNDTAAPVTFRHARTPSADAMTPFECLQCLFGDPESYYQAKYAT
jgi:hypothetical protein